MNVIRDEEMAGLMMIPLFNQYDLHRCNVKDCKEKQTTIVTGLTPYPFALCEDHYNEFKAKDEIKCTIEYD